MTREHGSYAVFRFLQVGSVLVPMLALALWALQAWDHRHEQAVETARNNVEIAREYVLRFVQGQEAALGEIDAMVRGMGWDEIAGSAKVQRNLERLNSGGVTMGIGIADASGVLRIAAHGRNLAIDISDRDYFAALRNGARGLVIGERIVGRVSGQDTFLIARRRSGPVFSGIIGSSVRVDALVRFFEQLRGDDGSAAALIGAGGNLLARRPATPPLTFSGESAVMQAVARTDYGMFEMPSPADGVERIYAYGRVGDLPLYVTFGVARETMVARWLEDMYWAALFAIAVALLGTTAATQALRRARADAAYRRRLGADVAARTAALEKALAEKDVLLREVHHRVKNNLQMMASMVGIVARRGDGDARSAFDEIRRRIVTVGQAYNAVYRADDLRSIDLASYLRSVADQILAGSGRRDIAVRSILEPVRVDIDTALPVGLIAHELLVNAFKHAFPAGRAGEIVMRLALQGNDAVLTVRDDGVGLPMEERADGTGLRLVHALAPQVDGRMATKAHDGGGAEFRLTFRLKRRKPG